MSIDRRDFLKAAGAAAGSLLLPVGAEAEAQAAKDRRREEIIATLRRLREEARDEELQRARERARRHAALLYRYPPITANG